MVVKVTITMQKWILDAIEQSRLETAARTGSIGNRSMYIRWLIHHGLEKADALNKKEE